MHKAKVEESSEWTSIVNTADENRANFCKGLDEKPHLTFLYGMYTVTFYELKVVLKVSAQAGKRALVNKPSMESKVQEDDLQEIKRRKRHNS
jgi:hypothetical protein